MRIEYPDGRVKHLIGMLATRRNPLSLMTLCALVVAIRRVRDVQKR